MTKKVVTTEDLCYSATAERMHIENVPDESSLVNLKALIEYIVQPIMEEFPSAMITSGYRCKELNREIGGVKNSQHLKGQAVDLVIVMQGKTIKESTLELYEFIAACLSFDQLIIYPTFIHVSYRAINRRLEIINKAPNCYPDIPEHCYLITHVRK